MSQSSPSQPEQVPWIRSPLPGPQAQQMIREDERYTSPSYTRVYPLAVASGRGAVLTDVDGNRFLDFTAGIAVCSTGHCHPHVVKAIQDQASRLIHMSGTDFYYAPQMELARRLAKLAPGDADKRVFFANSGAEAIEAAFKLARHHTGRQQMIAFRGAFHGRTMGALSLTASKSLQRSGFAPLVPGVHHVDYPVCSRCPRRPETGGCCEKPFEQLEALFRHTVSPREIAAIIVEPVLGEGGYVVPPQNFLEQLSELARQHGILLIADEVQAGMGRTGKMFAVEHWGIVPDIICLAKGIASGMPLGAIVAPADIMTWPSGAHASTFGGNPISCAAALATLDLLEDSLVENAARLGPILMKALTELARHQPALGDVRGLGLMVGVELVKGNTSQDGAGTREADPDCQKAVIQRCFQKGLLLLGCGTSTVRFCPPLVVDRMQVETAARLFGEAIHELTTDV